MARLRCVEVEVAGQPGCDSSLDTSFRRSVVVGSPRRSTPLSLLAPSRSELDGLCPEHLQLWNVDAEQRLAKAVHASIRPDDNVALHQLIDVGRYLRLLHAKLFAYV